MAVAISFTKIFYGINIFCAERKIRLYCACSDDNLAMLPSGLAFSKLV